MTIAEDIPGGIFATAIGGPPGLAGSWKTIDPSMVGTLALGERKDSGNFNSTTGWFGVTTANFEMPEASRWKQSVRICTDADS